MANEVVKIEEPEMQALMRMDESALALALKKCDLLIRSSMAPKGVNRAEQALIVIEHGRVLGFGPFESLNKVFVVNGRPALEAKTMLGLCQSRIPGFQFEPVPDKTDHDQVCFRARRSPNHEWVEETFTWAEMVETGSAANENVKKFRRDHLKYKCWKRLLLMLAADVLGGFDMAEDLNIDTAGGRILETDDYQEYRPGKPVVERPVPKPEPTATDAEFRDLPKETAPKTRKPRNASPKAGTASAAPAEPSEADKKAAETEQKRVRLKEIIKAKGAGYEAWKARLLAANNATKLMEIPLAAWVDDPVPPPPPEPEPVKTPDEMADEEMARIDADLAAEDDNPFALEPEEAGS